VSGSKSSSPALVPYSDRAKSVPPIGAGEGASGKSSTAGDSGTADLLTVDEVAAKMQVPRSWVYSHADDLGVMRLGKYLRFDWPTVLARLKSGIPTRPEVVLSTRSTAGIHRLQESRRREQI